MQAGDAVTPTIRLVRPLARGGMGSVWLAQHQTLQVEVAVKFCLGEGGASAHAAERFQREAALAFRIRSPHVVQIYDHGFTRDGIPYIAMERLNGEDLATRLQRLGPVELPTFAKWLGQIAEGLGQAHAAGVVHRDIKPSNIFLCDEPAGIRLKLLDFGVAKSALRRLEEGAQETVAGELLGTPAYMSPEQITNAREVDFRSDLWSLAAVTYQAVTGEAPFQGNTVAVLSNITRGAFVPPTQRRRELPAALDAWTVRALALDPGQRFQSAAALAEAFTTLAQGERSPSRWERPQSRALLALGALAAASVGTLGVWGLLGNGSHQTQTAPQNAESPVRAVAPVPAAQGATSAPQMNDIALPTTSPSDSALLSAEGAPSAIPRFDPKSRTRAGSLRQITPPRPVRALHLPNE
jgi:eukaryotic-like serine/threonine-protein kinase